METIAINGNSVISQVFEAFRVRRIVAVLTEADSPVGWVRRHSNFSEKLILSIRAVTHHFLSHAQF